MEFMEINSRGKRGELLERIDRQNSRFRTAKTRIIKFGFHGSFDELKSAKSVFNKIVRVQYFVRGGIVWPQLPSKFKASLLHLPVDGVRLLGGQKEVALQLQDARVSVGSTKDADPG
ncbi:hypothetical protein TNCV_3706181 [Trichonephila clavipes]|nr:hypothetical protein TNCV_3706181 [Trichonephila clavipes]